MFQYSQLAKLGPGSLVLTGNLRLARFLQEQYGQIQIAAGHEAWEQPKILHWQSWLNQSWQEIEHLSEARLLSEAQARLVWEQAISAESEHLSLLNLHASAKSAQQAWLLLHDWVLTLTDLGTAADEDVLVFKAWARVYSEKCAQRHWLDEARLAEHLYYSIAADQLSLPSEVLLAGFEEPSPIQQKIFDQFKAKGLAVGQLQENNQPGKQYRLSLPTTRDEIQAAAQWAKQCLTNEPAAKVAIVIPQLASVRADVARILDQELCPAVSLPGNQDQVRPYDISLGLPMSQYPLVFDALLMLECLQHRMSLEKVSRLLASVFIGHGEQNSEHPDETNTGNETNARALLDAWLREQGSTHVRIDLLARLAKGLDKNGTVGPHACPQLATRLSALLELKESSPTRQSSHDWAKHFTKTLNIFGWPGDRPLNSAEFQTVERWRKLLEIFAGLESISGLVTLHEAMGQLRNLANETIFQPESEAVAITVLGVLEAKGLTFDYLWLLGLDDETWPQAPRPHPLLPTRLQRELAMPHASAERELEFSRYLTNVLLNSASEVVVSSPEREDDKKLRPSPLIMEIPEATREKIITSVPEDYIQTIHKQGSLELLTEDQPPPLSTGADGVSGRGGTGLIKHQANCPFSAFARYRLGAQPFADNQAGLSAMERGSLVHRVLELLWGELKNQANLLKLSDEELNTTITSSIEQAINEQARFNPETFTKRFVEIETVRLTRLISQWLELEKQRPPFKVVAPEEQQFVTIAGLTLKLIIDRIDELENGDRLLIDYKTGANNNLNNWFDERPREPQLPMYSYLGNETGQPPAALAFAQLVPGDLRFIGLGDRDGISNGIKDISSDDKRGAADWSTQINDWKNVLERLAREYVDGVAVVDPKDDNSCTYCPYPELCRINELNQRLGHLMEAEQPDND